MKRSLDCFIFYLFLMLNCLLIYNSSNIAYIDSSDYIRLLIIGDSVDRYMVEDWCSNYQGVIMSERSFTAPNLTKTTQALTTVHQELKKFGMRRKAWDIRICDSSEKKIIIATIHNKFGVKPVGPWYCYH